MKKIVTEYDLFESRKGKILSWTAYYNDEALGKIEWYSKWRQYVWTQYPDIIMSDNCLQQIVNEIAKQNLRAKG